MAPIVDFGHIPESSDRTLFEIMYTDSVEYGRSMIFQGGLKSVGDFQNTTLNSTLDLYSVENIAYASSSIVLHIIHNWVDYNIFSVACGALPLMLWLAVKNLEILATSNRDPLEDVEGGGIILKFEELKMITRLLNSIWATLVFTIVIYQALFIIWLHHYMLAGDKIFIVFMCLRIAFVVVGVIMMAEACRFVSLLKFLGYK